ncbi:MAG: hypothetical protein WCR42_06915 [bacterium]
MKKILLLLIFVFAVSCSTKNDDTEKFLNAYKEILIVREQTNDNDLATKKINTILEKNGYTETEFRTEFMKLSQDKEKFLKLLDSIRIKASQEAINKKLPVKK